ncbi:tubulin polymerization-promoting protein homolog [Eurosta solidaginis]|uniref:tubulin polymerization-promoting protein homolog n=1 Tax=Eurosta solidaginis TaxID=178769 RepID=UPI0035309D1B
MADDDENKQKKHTIESLFQLYANNNLNALDLDNEVYESILLSQIDYWLEQAKLLKTVFTMTETGMAYMKFKKWRLNFEEFLDFMNIICQGKDIKIDDVKVALLEAGPPGSGEIVVVK